MDSLITLRNIATNMLATTEAKTAYQSWFTSLFKPCFDITV
jgi:hypothetical protein